MKVIDLSGWNDIPDFSQSPDEIGGIILKISEGSYTDEDFINRVNQIIGMNIPWGVYCYTKATNEQAAQDEAQNVVNVLSNYDTSNLKLGVWIDVEDQSVLAVGNLTPTIMAFLNVINGANLGAGIYAGYYVLRDNMDVSSIPDYIQYWVPEYGSNQCDFKVEHPEKTVAGWQYTDSYVIGNAKYDMSEWF